MSNKIEILRNGVSPPFDSEVIIPVASKPAVRPQKSKFLSVSVLVGTLCATSSFASLTAVGPFLVQYSETFDEFPPQDVQIWLPNPAPAFDGHAIMTGSDPLTLAVYTAPPAHPFAPYLPIDGAQFAVSQDTGFTTSFAFDTSLTDFGGYFGTGIIGQPTEIHTDFTVTYLDANNHIVGTATELPTTSALTWFGWHSDTPFTTVEVSAPAGFYLMDSLQVQAVPEPSTVMLLLVPFAFSGLRAIRKK